MATYENVLNIWLGMLKNGNVETCQAITNRIELRGMTVTRTVDYFFRGDFVDYKYKIYANGFLVAVIDDPLGCPLWENAILHGRQIPMSERELFAKGYLYGEGSAMWVDGAVMTRPEYDCIEDWIAE